MGFHRETYSHALRQDNLTVLGCNELLKTTSVNLCALVRDGCCSLSVLKGIKKITNRRGNHTNWYIAPEFDDRPRLSVKLRSPRRVLHGTICPEFVNTET
jgi:hypothetical protein